MHGGPARCSLTMPEKIYAATKCTCLCKSCTLQHFWSYIAVTRTTITTNYQSMQWICMSDTHHAQLICYQEVLEEFNLEITYQPGKLPTNADVLSIFTISSFSLKSIGTDHTLLQQHKAQQRPAWRTPELFHSLHQNGDNLCTPSGHISLASDHAH